MALKACRVCHTLVDVKRYSQCPNCRSGDLSSEYSGLVIIIDPESSEIAKHLNITKSGMYALRVR